MQHHVLLNDLTFKQHVHVKCGVNAAVARMTGISWRNTNSREPLSSHYMPTVPSWTPSASSRFRYSW